MTWLFASGHAVDLVLAIMLAECAILVTRRRHAMAIALTFAPGMLILLGLRASLTGSPWPLIALPLALSFPVHLADLRSRGLLRRDDRDRANAVPHAPTTSDSS